MESTGSIVRGYKFLSPYGTTAFRGVVTQYPLPEEDDWGPWFSHPEPAEPDGKDCGPGGWHMMRRIDARYAPARWVLWRAEGRGVIGRSEEKVRVREIRLRRVRPGALDRWLRAGHGDSTTLKYADLQDANLAGACLTNANLAAANLEGAVLEGADLTRAYLAAADLTGAALEGATLRRADLHGACLNGARLAEANLTGANLTDADLRRAGLEGSDLRGADLRDADLTFANLRGANLEGARLAGAVGL